MSISWRDEIEKIEEVGEVNVKVEVPFSEVDMNT